MKPLNALLFVALVATAGTAGWWFGQRNAGSIQTGGDSTTSTNSERPILYYQSAMHPWIKSDKPGNCTICGMALTAVYQGDKGFDAGAGVVALGASTIQAIHVTTDVVQRKALERTLRFAGTIEDDDSRHRFIAAYVAGRIDRLQVNYVGAEVVADQPLAQFYSPTLLTAQREYLALKQQAGSGGTAGALQAAAAQRLRQLGLSESQIEGLHELPLTNVHTGILSPMTGTVVSRFVYEGEYVMEGQKLFELADFSTMWFQFDAYEQDLPWLAIGQEVVVTTPSQPGRSFAGRIAFIDPNVRDLSRSARVRVELPNPLLEVDGRAQRLLLHRLFAEATVQVATEPTLLVPRAAVLKPGDQAVVYVDQGGGSYEHRSVKLGRRGDSHWEVLDGLAAGEMVVTQGNLLIDAQAQLNSGAGPAHEHSEHGGGDSAEGGRPARLQEAKLDSGSTKPTALPAVSSAQRAALDELFASASGIGAALAADDLTVFNERIHPLHDLLPRMERLLEGATGWSAIAGHLGREGHLVQAGDLRTARAAFHRFATPVSELALALRQQDTNAVVKVFQCPMTSKSFEGAPARARWVQLTGEVRNPFYGAAMIDCGTEIKPE